MTEAFLRAAGWWDADVGPPRAEIFSRSERLAASFETRILAHVIGEVADRSGMALAELPWVIGSPAVTHGTPRPEVPLRRAMAARGGCAIVEAGPATVAMTLVEALGVLVDHEHVVVAFTQDATLPYNEALASALVLSRRSSTEDRLRLVAPRLRRGSTREIVAASRPALAAALALARAVAVGKPTVETVPTMAADRPESWRIELCRAF